LASDNKCPQEPRFFPIDPPHFCFVPFCRPLWLPTTFLFLPRSHFFCGRGLPPFMRVFFRRQSRLIPGLGSSRATVFHVFPLFFVRSGQGRSPFFFAKWLFTFSQQHLFELPISALLHRPPFFAHDATVFVPRPYHFFFFACLSYSDHPFVFYAKGWFFLWFLLGVTPCWLLSELSL